MEYPTLSGGGNYSKVSGFCQVRNRIFSEIGRSSNNGKVVFGGLKVVKKFDIIGLDPYSQKGEEMMAVIILAILVFLSELLE